LFDDGEAFLRTAQSGISGCIVLDVRLRGIGGLEIQRRLSEMGSVVPVIFITGHGDVEMAVEAMIAANPQLSNPTRLYPGDKVNLPKAAGAPTPAQ